MLMIAAAISEESLRKAQYDNLQKDRPELKLPDWFDLPGEITAAIVNGGFDIAAERAAYIMAGGSTRWADDEWNWDVPF